MRNKKKNICVFTYKLMKTANKIEIESNLIDN